MHKSCKNDIPASKMVLFFFHRWFFPFTLNSICAIKLTSHKFIYITCIYGEGMMWLLVMSILKSFVWHYNNPILLYIYPTRHVLYPYDIFFRLVNSFLVVVIIVVGVNDEKIWWKLQYTGWMKGRALFIMQSINNNNYTFHHRNSPFYLSCFTHKKSKFCLRQCRLH